MQIYKINTTDTLSGVINDANRSIEWRTDGYTLYNNDDTLRTLQVSGASVSDGATVATAGYSNDKNCKWTLSKETSVSSGVYRYDETNKVAVADPERMLDVGETESLSDLKIVPV